MSKLSRSPAKASLLPALITRSSAEDRDELTRSYHAALLFRDTAVASLQTKWNAIKSKQVADVGYESPAWPYRQAAFNGQLQEIENTLTHLFNVKVKHYGNE